MLASPSGGVGMELYNVASIENMRGPFASDLQFRGVQYEHVPNEDVSGLFDELPQEAGGVACGLVA